MNLLNTKSFQLATYSAGDENATKLALLLPGGLDTKDYAHMRSHVDFFSQKGYFALVFDPPGTWESPGDISLYTTANYLKAIDELVDHFGCRPTVAMGHSRGGSMAMLAGIKNPHITHSVAVMSNCRPSIMRESAREAGIYTTYRDLPPGTERTKEKKRFDLPLSYFADPTEYTGLDQCPKPKLFFLGTHDTIATPESVRETYNQAANPKQLHELNSGHDYRLQRDIIDEVNKVTAEFLGI